MRLAPFWTTVGGLVGRGRLMAATVLVAYFLIFLLFGSHWWGRLGMPGHGEGHFQDFQTVTYAWDCIHRGIHNIIPHDPCDPRRYVGNDYPRIWSLPGYLGLGHGVTRPLAYAMTICFCLAALLVLPRTAGTAAGLVYAGALCSPAVMLGVENGNNDQAIFVVVAAALLLLARRSRYWPVGGFLLLFAAILKLFPIFAVAALLRQAKRRALIAAAAITGAFGIYVLATIGDIRAIDSVAPKTFKGIYNLDQIGLWAEPTLPFSVSHFVWDALFGLAAFGIALLASRSMSRRLRPAAETDVFNRDLGLFWAGACVFVGTFVYPSFRSYDYRLMFLLLAVPQLIAWLRASKTYATVSLALLIAALWLVRPYESIPKLGALFVHWDSLTALKTGSPLFAASAANFLLFAALLVGLVATVPTPALRRALTVKLPLRISSSPTAGRPEATSR